MRAISAFLRSNTDLCLPCYLRPMLGQWGTAEASQTFRHFRITLHVWNTDSDRLEWNLMFQALRSSALWRGSLNPTSGWPGWHEQSAFPSLPGAGAPSGPGRWAQPLPACPHAGRIRQRSRVLGGDRGGQGDGAGSPRVRVLEAQVIRGWPFRQARPGWGRTWERGAVWGVLGCQSMSKTRPIA